MNQGLIPRRYAKALYKVALERGCDERMYLLMLDLDEAYSSEAALGEALSNPFVPQADKDRLAATAAGAAEQDTLFFDFLNLLTQNRRFDLIGLTAKAYVDVYRKAHKIHRVELISATKMPREVVDRIKRLVESHLNGGSMEFETRVDPDLIGGFVINIDNERLDASLDRQINDLKMHLVS